MDGSQTRQTLVQQLYRIVDAAKMTRDHYTYRQAEEAVDQLVERLIRIAGGPCTIDEKALNVILEVGAELVKTQRQPSLQPLLTIQALAVHMERSGYRPNFRVLVKGGAQ